MATLVINKSGGIVHLDSIHVLLEHGARKEYQVSYNDLVVVCPELAQLERAGHIAIIEDAEVVPVELEQKPEPMIIAEPQAIVPQIVEPVLVVEQKPEEPAKQPDVEGAKPKKKKKSDKSEQAS